MKKIFKRAVSLILVLALSVSFSACGKSKSVLSYSLSSVPTNLDPQTTTDYNAMEVIENIYEGLFIKDKNGNATLGAAESYEVSDDGTTYTFKIKKGNRWKYYQKDNKFEDEKLQMEVTANDFVFAFKRLMDPSTVSPYALNFYCLQNAEKVHNGILNSDMLGVHALDDYTLQFKLDYANPLFPELLESEAASPCNQEFFEKTMGQYGLSRDTIISNGPFYLSEWAVNQESSSYVRIRTNSFYPSAEDIQISGVNFTARDESEAFDSLVSGDIHMAVLSTLQKDGFNESRYQVTKFSNAVYGIGIRQDDPIFSNGDLRLALASCIDRDSYSGTLTSDQEVARAIIPNAVTVLDQNYRQDVGDNFAIPYQKEEAAARLKRGLNAKGISDLNSVVMLVPEGCEEVAQQLLQIWQRDLGIFMQMDSEPEETYQKKLKAGDFSIAFLQLASQADTPASILSSFTTGSSANILHYSSAAYDRIYKEALVQGSIQAMEEKFKVAEQCVINDASFIPIYFQNQYFVVKKEVRGVVFDPASKMIRFMYAQKK